MGRNARDPSSVSKSLQEPLLMDFPFESVVRGSVRLKFVLTAWLVCGLNCIKAEAEQAEFPSKPNYVVIFCDNLGYGDIEPFGSTLHRTPNLNRMASEGRKFTHFYVSAGVCTPSRASLLTGCYSQRLGMHLNERDGHVLRPVSPYGLNPEEETIAEVLKEVGYATGIFGKWHLGDQQAFLPTKQGFDTFFGIPYSDDMTAEVGRRVSSKLDGALWPPLPLMMNEKVIEAPVDRNQLTQRLTKEAVKFIEQHRDEPFFLYFPQAMPGSTTAPFSSDAFRGKSANGPWGDSIEELDWSTGEILDALEKLELDQKTLVIWTSDNGAPLARNPSDLSRGSNQPLHGRGYTTSEGAFRVPTLAWWPGRISAGSICEEIASTMDLLPTFAKWSGGRLPQRLIDGKDISELMIGEKAKSPHEAIYYYDRDQLQAVRRGRWKLFLPLETYGRHPHFTHQPSRDPLLFDLVSDQSCQHDVAGQHPQLVQELSRLADEARRELGDSGVPGRGARSRGEVVEPIPQVVDRKDGQ